MRTVSDQPDTTPPLGDHHRHLGGGPVFEVAASLCMVFGRGATAKRVVDLAGVHPGMVVVDVGCGPGAAARSAARRGATVTGVDPSPMMRRLARWLSALQGAHGVTWLDGTAEQLPVGDATADVLWAVASLHHWADEKAGIAEARRVLRPGGRVIFVERRTAEGAHGLRAHGHSPAGASAVTGALTSAGFSDVVTSDMDVGRHRLVVIDGRVTGA